MITTNLYYKKIGQGYPLIMLHGNGENIDTLLSLGEALSTDFLVYLVDSSGHGKSPGEIHTTYDEMAEDLIHFMVQNRINKAHIFGYSDGAIVALKATITHPHLFNKLILCGMNISPDGLIDESINEIKESYLKEKNPLHKLMLEGPIFNVSDLEHIEHKITLYFGEHDAIKIAHQHLIHQLLKHSDLHIMNHESHGSYICYSNKLSKELKMLLK